MIHRFIGIKPILKTTNELLSEFHLVSYKNITMHYFKVEKHILDCEDIGNKVILLIHIQFCVCIYNF